MEDKEEFKNEVSKKGKKHFAFFNPYVYLVYKILDPQKRLYIPWFLLLPFCFVYQSEGYIIMVESRDARETRTAGQECRLVPRDSARYSSKISSKAIMGLIHDLC